MKELKGENKHLYLLIGALILLCLILIASLHRTEKAYYQVKNEKDFILSLASKSEFDQLQDDAIWFQRGCELGADTMIEENKQTVNDPNVELSLLAYKTACSDTAKDVYKQIVTKYKKELSETSGQ